MLVTPPTYKLTLLLPGGLLLPVGFKSGFGFELTGFGFGFGFKKTEVDSDSSGFGFEMSGFGSGFGFKMTGFAHHCSEPKASYPCLCVFPLYLHSKQKVSQRMLGHLQMSARLLSFDRL